MDVNYLVFWGVFGMIVEICFTAVRDLISKREFNLMGHTSLWMFPVYAIGLSHGIDFVIELISNDILRILSYPFWIWGIEILVGVPAVWLGIRIWDYNYLSNQHHWRGIISFVHYPMWVGLGILVEMIK